jgi:hypothetical protein
LAPLLPDEDYQQLAKLIEEFQQFGVGKAGLIQLRDYEYTPDSYDYPIDYGHDVNRVVQENGEHRTRYNDLLRKMQARSTRTSPSATVRCKGSRPREIYSSGLIASLKCRSIMVF